MLDELLALVPVSTTAKQAVVNRLREPHRRYHDLRHVVEMWQWHKRYTDHSIDSSLVACYCLYHDAVYDPVSKNNEVLSAALWAQDSGHQDLNQQVYNAILASSDHFRWHAWPHVRWCLNLDLLRLGTPEEEFTQHGFDIRAEYEHVSEEDWVRMSATWRAKVMSHSEIFWFPQFAEFEAQARRNLARALLQDWRTLGYL